MPCRNSGKMLRKDLDPSTDFYHTLMRNVPQGDPPCLQQLASPMKTVPTAFSAVKVAALTLTLCLLIGADVSAQQMRTSVKTRDSLKVNHELKAQYSYVGGGDMQRGNNNVGIMQEHYGNFGYIASLGVAENANLRLGMGWDRFSFESIRHDSAPNTLQAINLNIGADISLSEQWLMRVEVQPGFYSDFQDISFDDVNMPMNVGFSYIVNRDLLFVFGLNADPRREIPVFPGVGFRWQINDQWVLNFIPPNPRVEYIITPEFITYLGLDIKGGTFTVAEDFGNDRDEHHKLANDTVSYREVRVGIGFEYQIHPGIKAHIEGGYVADRTLNFERSNQVIHQEEGAGYVSVGLGGNF